MLFKGKKEAKRLEMILKDYTPGGDPVVAAHSFVRAFLDPQPDRYDVTYRSEHSLTVA